MMGPARAARHRPYNACPLLHTGAASSQTSGMSMVAGRRRQPKPAHSPGSRLPARASPAWAAPPSLATTADSYRRRLCRPKVRVCRGRVVEAARSEAHLAARPLPFPQEPTPGTRSEREPASEAGGRVGVGPGLLRRPPSSESHGGAHSSSRLAPTTPTKSSQRRTSPLVSARPPRRSHPGRWSHQAA